MYLPEPPLCVRCLNQRLLLALCKGEIMRKLQTVLLLITLCATTMLIACDSATQPSAPTATEAIKLAKQAASQLASPPRAYDKDFIPGVENHPFSNVTPTSTVTPVPPKRINGVKSWPDDPGSTTTTYSASFCSSQGSSISSSGVITLTTVVTNNQAADSTSVTFISSWQAGSGVAKHSWQFDVDRTLIARFADEQGEGVPLCVIEGAM